MDKHPVENVMDTTLEHLKNMIDVDTVVGKPVFSENGVLIIPLSKVGFGFVAGGTQFGQAETLEEELPFGGGAGGGMSVSPCGFLVINGGKASYLPAQGNDSLDKVLAALPGFLQEVKTMVCGCGCGCDEQDEDDEENR